MILGWILDIFEYSDLRVSHASFEALTRLDGHRVLASILLNMFLGWRCVKFVMFFTCFPLLRFLLFEGLLTFLVR